MRSELFRKGLIGEAMTEVKKGNFKGYVSTPDLAKHVIEQLALAGLKASVDFFIFIFIFFQSVFCRVTWLQGTKVCGRKC